jgi:hypothetical protein
MDLKVAGEAFQIVEMEEAVAAPNASKNPHSGSPDPEEPQSWEDQLISHLKSLRVKDSAKILSLPKILPEPVFLEISTGPQAGEVFIISWAPFEFGHLSLEGNLWEDRAPQRAFLIDFIQDHCVFRTDHPKIVQVNRSELTEKRLYDGDKIFIGPTELTFRSNS